MRIKMTAALGAALLALFAHGADLDAGRETAQTCSACHGANGISASDTIPNLAGQKAAYLQNQLNAFRSETRKNPLMNAIATQLSDADIDNVSAYFSGLSAPGESESSPLGKALTTSEIEFPADYRNTFKLYSKVNQEKQKRVRHNYANEAALQGPDQNGMLADNTFVLTEIYSAKLDDQGQPQVGADGFYIADKLLVLAAMEKRPGWGERVPALLRNGDWAYALYTPEQKLRDGLNQAACLACHKPLHEVDYLFSYKDLISWKN